MRIRLFTSMRIQIWLFKVLQICNITTITAPIVSRQGSTVHCETPQLMAFHLALIRIRLPKMLVIHADPDSQQWHKQFWFEFSK